VMQIFRRYRVVASSVTVLVLMLSFAGFTLAQDIPDAPSAVQPPPPPPPKPSLPANNGQASPSETAPSSSEPVPSTSTEAPGPPPPMKVTTVPPGSVSNQPGAQEELYKLSVNVNQVIVPVRVTDESGRMVSGLLARDFSVYEDGKKQTMNFFTSDPFALSAAVIIDLGMSDVGFQKVNKTFSALEGAFAPFDEVAIYTYSTGVGRVSDFTAAGRQLEAALNSLKNQTGEANGVPVTGGPLGPQGPTINDIPVGSPTTPVIGPSKHSHVLNDAILRAAMDLGKREKTRRKVIFVISDGREYRSDASYSTVLQVLLSNGILLYGVAVEGSAIPGYKTLEKLHIPGQGYGNILPKYASATGGEILSEYSRSSIENVYEGLIGDARNQYTLGYVARATPSDAQRQIDVRVDRPGCKSSNLRPCVDVYAKQGYYPLPARR
jgi:VWFA-related protein